MLFVKKNLEGRTPVDLSVPAVNGTRLLKKVDYANYKKFLELYDPKGDKSFSKLQFRAGAPITCPFGLSEGFKHNDKGEMEWGYVRLHAGEDRARGGSFQFSWGTVDDIVYCPFDANRSEIIEYGNEGYGTLIRLYLDEFGFEFRVGHMNPDQKVRKGNEKGPIIPWSLDRLKKGKSFQRGWCLGSAGTKGASSGAHTHAELKSLDDTAPILDRLLFDMYGKAADTDYSDQEIVAAYRAQIHYKEASEEKILADFAVLKKEKKVIVLNQYKCQYVDWDNSVKTRYSPSMLFNGL
jgi:hypothetical protein